MIDKAFIVDTIDDYLLNSDTFLVDLNIRPGNIIVVEIDSKDGVTLEECIALNKHIESKLDREVEDFELEVGSAGVTSPFKILKQFEKNVGNEVEVLTRQGKKITGLLKACDTNSFVVTIVKKEKPEGAKRKIEIEEDLTFTYEEVKYTKYLIRFK